MNKVFRDLQQRQIADLLAPWTRAADQPLPPSGWISAIRHALGMSGVQFAKRLGMTRQGVSLLESREAEGSITLDALRKAAEALDAKLVYAIVPRTSLTETVRAQAQRKAEEELHRVAHSMRLEAQNITRDEHHAQIADRAEELLRTRPRELWD